MQLIPAIDIRGGKCVRLTQGDPSRQTDYSDSPVQIAQQFADAGAEKIHVVDLDGAIEGESENQAVIRDIVDSVPAKIELGGGIRALEHIENWLTIGVHEVILGTVSVKEPEIVRTAVDAFGSQHVVVGVDARDGKVATHGWQKVSGETATDFARKMEDMGVRRFIFTAIETDGMMTGPALDSLRAFAESTTAAVTASGGVRNIDDVLSLRDLESSGVDSVIAGKAIYEGELNVAEAIQLLSRERA